jgi:transposase
MTQRDRDRLVASKKAKRGLITQRQAAEEIGQSERHVRRLLRRLKGKGDAALVHALRGRQSNRRLQEKTKQKALEILRCGVYRGFGPTLAAEYLDRKHDIHAGRKTVDDRGQTVACPAGRVSTRSTSGGCAAREWANWSNGIPASMPG